MKNFLTASFLLKNPSAERLYFDFAQALPILDYHNHLPPEAIGQNQYFDNLTQIWLYGDHYKWRAMRTHGIAEHFITGKASDWEKFLQWAKTVPYTLRNPLYHWTHLELQNPFGIQDTLNEQSASLVYESANVQLQNRWSTQALLHHFKVEVICTTDDPIDPLTFHGQSFSHWSGQLRPTFRPDRAMSPENQSAYLTYLHQLEEASQIAITSWDTFLEAVQNRHDFFASKGCVLSDHGIESLYAEAYTEAEIRAIFLKLRQELPLSSLEIKQFKSACLYEFAKMDFAKGWVQQFHLGAIRNTNTRLLQQLGADAGVDSIGDFPMAHNLVRFFDRLEQEDKLTKTILYNLNPADNELFASLVGNYQDGRIAGKMQYGAAWWFLDQKDGIIRQLNALSNLGLLSHFVGMLTDSRSFLSFSRHDYFRRILCNLLGEDIENGELPRDFEWIGHLVRQICYANALRYFGFSPQASISLSSQSQLYV